MKLLPGVGFAELQGTTKGVTIQKWRSLLVIRKKPTPNNPNTPRQSAVRSIMTLLSRRWRDVLTTGLRIAWNQRATEYPWLDVFGREAKMTGENLYIKQNFVLLDSGRAVVDQPIAGAEPPEIDNISVDPVPTQTFNLNVLQVPSGIVTAQDIFLDVWIAGGFITVDDTSNAVTEYTIETNALPAGRTHQVSDFVHAGYITEKPDVPPAPPDTGALLAEFNPLVAATRNFVLSIRRYNKFGNFTQPVIFEGLRTRP